MAKKSESRHVRKSKRTRRRREAEREEERIIEQGKMVAAESSSQI